MLTRTLFGLLLLLTLLIGAPDAALAVVGVGFVVWGVVEELRRRRGSTVESSLRAEAAASRRLSTHHVRLPQSGVSVTAQPSLSWWDRIRGRRLLSVSFAGGEPHTLVVGGDVSVRVEPGPPRGGLHTSDAAWRPRGQSASNGDESKDFLPGAPDLEVHQSHC